MAMVASRELRNRMRSLVTRAKNGETITITVDGEPVAELRALTNRRRWIPRDEVFASFTQADPGLRRQLRGSGDTIAAHDRRERGRRMTATRERTRRR